MHHKAAQSRSSNGVKTISSCTLQCMCLTCKAMSRSAPTAVGTLPSACPLARVAHHRRSAIVFALVWARDALAGSCHGRKLAGQRDWWRRAGPRTASALSAHFIMLSLCLAEVSPGSRAARGGETDEQLVACQQVPCVRDMLRRSVRRCDGR